MTGGVAAGDNASVKSADTHYLGEEPTKAGSNAFVYDLQILSC